MTSMKQFKVVEMVGKGSFASVYKVRSEEAPGMGTEHAP